MQMEERSCKERRNMFCGFRSLDKKQKDGNESCFCQRIELNPAP